MCSLTSVLSQSDFTFLSVNGVFCLPHLPCCEVIGSDWKYFALTMAMYHVIPYSGHMELHQFKHITNGEAGMTACAYNLVLEGLKQENEEPEARELGRWLSW